MKIRITFVGTDHKPVFLDTANEKSNFFIGKSFPSMIGGIPNDKVLVMVLESQMNADQPALPFAVNPGFAPGFQDLSQLKPGQRPQLVDYSYSNHAYKMDPANIFNSPKFFTKMPEELMPFIQFLADEQCNPTIKVEVLNNNGDVIFTDNIVKYGYHYI